MADDKKKTGADRARVAATQQYELSYFRRKHNLSVEEAKDIIKQAKNSREKANELAKKKSK
ncbi:MAG: DUF3606 domain-containing protein [Oxalobacteraceae bacterium]|nr:MAG: DUF3606 domain-containing protein [Oxalobacteraceae bacterium]